MRRASLLLLAITSATIATVTAIATIAAAAPCPAITIKVDNDIAGSGYSEQQPGNWQTGTVASCSGTYRYLSKHVGDLSSKGKATWKPNITTAGWYKVVTSYRATVNRTDDADYFVYDDLGGSHHQVVNQAQPTDCTKHDLGTIYCAVGGNCRVVLDGTDDGKSDSADLTTFQLTSCEGPDGGAPPSSPCDGIAAHASYEVCVATATTCAGTFDDGSGCTAYCAAAGMACVARFGGNPGCSKETGVIACDANNGHMSDWCECQLPEVMDAGIPEDAGAAQGGSGGASGATTTTTVSGEGGYGGGFVTTTSSTGGATTTAIASGGAGGKATQGAPSGSSSEPSSCACGLARSPGGAGEPLGILMAASLAALRRRRASEPRASES